MPDRPRTIGITVSPRLIEGLAARDTYAENGMAEEPAKTQKVEVRLGSEKDPSLTWQGNPPALTRLVSAHAPFCDWTVPARSSRRRTRFPGPRSTGC
ncbi:hypothetical protein ACI2L1_40820 [Streptomyces sp. NPDC019531]|uniref:hypothetical protein n=1 Tax=Streptomyces sp. NPDC019531 TaxID=3365062 RepID=UPI00384C4D52